MILILAMRRVITAAHTLPEYLPNTIDLGSSITRAGISGLTKGLSPVPLGAPPD